MNSAEAFLDHCMKRMMTLLRGRETDNFDHDRFSPEGIPEEAFSLRANVNYLYFLLQNHKALAEAEQVFADAASRALFRDLIEFRLVGHLHKRLPTNTSTYWTARAQALALPSTPSPFAARVERNGLGYQIERVAVPSGARTLNIDCWKVAAPISFAISTTSIGTV